MTFDGKALGRAQDSSDDEPARPGTRWSELSAAAAAAEERSRPLPGGGLHSVGRPRGMSRLRFQLPVGLLMTSVLPSVVYYFPDSETIWHTAVGTNTAMACVAAFIITLMIFRKAATLPGIGVFGHVFPALLIAYGSVVAALFSLRLEYSRLTIFGSFVAAAVFFFLIGLYVRSNSGRSFYLVPSRATMDLTRIATINWTVLHEPVLPKRIDAAFVVDLRADLSDDWERLTAEAALRGYPVYHVKQVAESLTGRVEIEHLSENSFGSLIPGRTYLTIKRLIDCATALLAMPFVIVIGIPVAIAIKLESPGPIFFTQVRRGYRGLPFKVVKFRTMVHAADAAAGGRDAAITVANDCRITRFGRFLRQSRIDELPQIWNILKGEMSWIGPRPEAITLSDWYMRELPFYSYRHIVRPGITGWAQVSQGHVADLRSVYGKLHYDFYYIKYFSAGLDLFIAARTVATMVTGFGAK